MITDSIKYVGVNDHNIDLFEGQFDVPNGMAYNSYIIISDKIAVMDSVEADFGDEWLTNVRKALKDAGLENRSPDYLIVQHMEMDHAATLNRNLARELGILSRNIPARINPDVGCGTGGELYISLGDGSIVCCST